MYEQVLPQLGLGTPQGYGSRWEPAQGRLWLLMEDVGPHRLARSLDLEAFVHAVSWLARFHAATAGTPPDPRLLRLDRGHYERMGSRLAAHVHEIPTEDRLLVGRVLGRYDELLGVVDAVPQGLLHGEFFPKNVMIRAGSPGVAVIDWETAAIGPQYVDLVSMTAGRWSGSQRAAMRRAYFEGRRPAGSRAAARDDEWDCFTCEVNAVAVLQAVCWLGFLLAGDAGIAKRAKHVAQWTHQLRTAVEQHS
jgi:aminoglycoside phosphotransferase (APT) family kinase protein